VLVTGSGLSAAAAAEERLVAYGAAKAALAASGTVSLELAAAGTPMVIAYDMGLISRLIIGAMLQIDTVTLVNLYQRPGLFQNLLEKTVKPHKSHPLCGKF